MTCTQPIKHPQVRVQHGELYADVDEELAPLILAMWKRGISTIYSCQDPEQKDRVGYAHIQLDVAPAAELCRIVYDPNEVNCFFHTLFWEWETYPVYRGANGVVFMITLLFPLAQRDLIIRRLGRDEPAGDPHGED